MASDPKYDILSVVLQTQFVTPRWFEGYSPRARFLVLPKENTIRYVRSGSKETFDETFASMSARLRGLQPDTLRDFIGKTRAPEIIEPQFVLTIPYVIFDSDSVKVTEIAGGKEWWEEFRKTYPQANGAISISQVGFNSSQTQALTCVGIHQGRLMGSGSNYLLEKGDDEWRIKQKSGAWIS
jgi:hypothetical protein